MPRRKSEYFTSRWGFILSMMGVAVGAGNIWRFSRIVAQNGGGSFIIPWVLFLFIWSIPLILAEIAMGKLTRKAPIGALALTGGRSVGWMGAFICLVTTGILFYYSVVVGWGFRYFFYSLTGAVTTTSDHFALWTSYTKSLQPFFSHVLAISLGCFIIYKGIVRGVERSNKILIPALLLMILVIAWRAVTLPGAWKGIEFFFTPKLSDLANYKIWIEALTQNAWDTGAGWGLLLVYAGYAKQKESITINGTLTAFANNAVSLVMGITIFATAFAVESTLGLHELISGEGATNVGLTFIYLPGLFTQLPGGAVVQAGFAALFFLAFSIAALSSMISMVQLTAQTFQELGMRKNRAIVLTGLLALVLGAPSALNLAFFENQDWVWSLGLIVSGLFIALGVVRYGADKFRKEALNQVPHDFRLGKFYNWMISYLIPFQAIVLIGWYFYRSIAYLNREEWWNPFQIYSVGTVALQWGIGVAFFIYFNKWLVKKTLDH